MTKAQDPYSNLLKIFDDIQLSSMDLRRVAFKALYDYFQRWTLGVGEFLCGLEENVLGNYALGLRWKILEPFLASVSQDAKKWGDMIREVHGIRNSIEHTDYYDPNKGRLTAIRKQAPDFAKWLMSTGKDYYHRSKNFTLKEAFCMQSEWYLALAEMMLDQYGDKEPYVSMFRTRLRDEDYEWLPELTESVRRRHDEIGGLEDIQPDDLRQLIELVNIVSELKATESTLLRYSVCPKCGGEVEESQTSFGGTMDHPEPDGIFCRVGCKECDYELHTETIHL